MKVNEYLVQITMNDGKTYDFLDYSESPRTPEPNRFGFIPIPIEDGGMLFLGQSQIRTINVTKTTSD
jgi:hypothetical protein